MDAESFRECRLDKTDDSRCAAPHRPDFGGGGETKR